MNVMKALVKAKAEKGIWMQDIPIPETGCNDVLIKVRKTAICGTDLHIYLWDEWAKKTIPVPMQIGHEFMGTIEKIGAGVKRFKEGARVSGEGHIVCGHCRNCRAGRGHLCRNTLGLGLHPSGAFVWGGGGKVRGGPGRGPLGFGPPGDEKGRGPPKSGHYRHYAGTNRAC